MTSSFYIPGIANSPINILLVEDSLTDAQLLFQILNHSNYQAGWQMLHVEDLAEGIDTCQRQVFDVVLLDLHLPDSAGLETVSAFRVAVPQIPVVVLTGMDDEALALQAMAEGAQDYLVKGQIVMQQLVRSIRYAIERHQIIERLKQSEQRTRQALEREEELNRLKSRFVSMVSHEFRTPITVIRTAIELLQQPPSQIAEAKRRDYFVRIKMAIQQVLHLLDETLILSRAESCSLKYDPTVFDLQTFCHELVETLRLSSSSQPQITLTLSGNCTQVEMDQDLLRHILTNLLSNAIKYSPENTGVELDLRCGSEVVVFEIRDHGIGIPEADIPLLFETFHRATNVSGIPGTGLGLTIVKKCVDLHQGIIDLKSEVGVGTTIIVKLPLKPQPVTPLFS